MTRMTRGLLGASLLGVLLYGGFVIHSGHAEIGATLQRFEASAFLAALGLSCVNYGLRYLKWEYYLTRLDVRGIPKFDSLLVFLSGFVLTITPGKVGEVFKSAVLARLYGVAMSRTAPIIIAERLTDVIGVVTLILVGSLGFEGGGRWAAAGAAAVGLGLVAILWPTPARRAFAWLSRRGGRGRVLVPSLERAYGSLRTLATPRALPLPSLLSVIGWGCEGWALLLIIEGFGAHADVALVEFFYATATLAGALIPVPGGLGVTEAMIREQLVHLAQLDVAVATSSMILVRFATLWWAVVVGFLALGALRLRHAGFAPPVDHKPTDDPRTT